MAEPLKLVGNTLINPAYVVSIAVTSGSWESPETVVVTLSTGTQLTYAGDLLKTALPQLVSLSGGMLGQSCGPRNPARCASRGQITNQMRVKNERCSVISGFNGRSLD